MAKVRLVSIAAIAVILAIAGIQCASRLKRPQALAAQLAQGIMRARSSLPRFRDRLELRLPTDRAYFVRAEFSADNRRTEYLWLNRVVLDPGGFKARVAERPFILTTVHQGDEVAVTNGQVVDWTIVRSDGTREGNFTQGLEP